MDREANVRRQSCGGQAFYRYRTVQELRRWRWHPGAGASSRSSSRAWRAHDRQCWPKRARACWAGLSSPRRIRKPYLDFAAARAGKFDQLLIVGIGGSALGTIALSTSLLPFRWNELTSAERQGRPRLYVLDNVDPDETASLLDLLDLKRTLVNVISKSGTTAETMASYLVVLERLEGGGRGRRAQGPPGLHHRY